MKKTILILMVYVVLITNLFAKVQSNDKLQLVSGNYIYTTYYEFANKKSQWFACIRVDYIGEKSFSLVIPVYMVKLNPLLEQDVQMKQIQSIQFTDENSIKIEGVFNDVYTLDINDYSIKCINNASEQSKYEYITDQEEVSKSFYNIYEESYKYVEDYKYKGEQSDVTKIENMEQLCDVCSKALYPIYGEETIEKERPYNIFKYKSYYLVFGSLFKPVVKKGVVTSVRGGVFEVIVNPEDSQVLYLIHSK